MNYKIFQEQAANDFYRNLGGTKEAYKRYLSKNFNEERYNQLLKTIEE